VKNLTASLKKEFKALTSDSESDSNEESTLEVDSILLAKSEEDNFSANQTVEDGTFNGS
jgi:hypothetical protein